MNGIRGAWGHGRIAARGLRAWNSGRPGGAKALVEKTCGTGCHSIEVVTSQRMVEKEWKAIVGSMVARGASASDAQAATIVDYLVKTLGR